MKKDFLICIDSDGCVFDTMEVKHKECFCPSFIRHFRLQAVSKYARDAWDFTNLYSATRGIHRLRALLRALEVLRLRKEVQLRGFTPPALPHLERYVSEGGALSNAALEEYRRVHPECAEEFEGILAWSADVNARIAELVFGVPPFPYVRECLEALSSVADIVVVSATPYEALEREWKEHGLLRFTASVEGQESGTKKEIIASLKDRYPRGHVLMIGDAPGDREAAHTNGVLFYPICPDGEADSWRRFGEAAELFLQGKYAGEREAEEIARFETLLPTDPRWAKGE